MLVRDINPIKDPTCNFLEEDIDIIDRMVELPLRKACRAFLSKGIETIMSSANKSNILNSGEERIEREDIDGDIFNHHDFLEAGRGYAWLMINFDSLSDENKDLVFDLYDKDTSGKMIWLVHPTMMDGNIEYSLRSGKYDMDFLRMMLSEDEIPKGIQVDLKLQEFDKRCFPLLYPWEENSTESVFIRMPINESTTVEEVEEYFLRFANLFKNQKVEKKHIL